MRIGLRQPGYTGAGMEAARVRVLAVGDWRRIPAGDAGHGGEQAGDVILGGVDAGACPDGSGHRAAVAAAHLVPVPVQVLAGVAGELASRARKAADRSGAEGLLVFDDTGSPATATIGPPRVPRVLAGRQAGLAVLAWALPATVASRLAAETGQDFAGQPPGLIDLCVCVSRTRQRRAAFMHASQISPTAVLWRRLQLQGECEHLRWLVPPKQITASPPR